MQRCCVESGAVWPLQDPSWSALVPSALQAALSRVDPAPEGDAEHWVDLAAAKAGLSGLSVVQRIWRAHRLQPNGARQLLGDPQAAADICAIVGLYLRPPTDAIVLAVDEKGQIPVTDRIVRNSPRVDDDLGARRPEERPTTTLFCALDVHSGRVIGRCMQRQRVREFVRFLNVIKREIPPETTVHMILDNYGPHRHAAVVRWLERHPRFAFHYTPTRMSWVNLAEIYLARLTRDCLRRYTSYCVIDLQIVINAYVAQTNAHPQPYI